MYLDTLKVSTLEQTAEETSARGGKGNPELITWDYGKEISLSLEDALYTPASQSLMWGGKFGIKKPKVQGLWNPLVYPKDEYGRTQYLEKIVFPNFTTGYFTFADGTPVEELPIPTAYIEYGYMMGNGAPICYMNITNSYALTDLLSMLARAQGPFTNAVTGETIEDSEMVNTSLTAMIDLLGNTTAGTGWYLVERLYGVPVLSPVPDELAKQIIPLPFTQIVTFICPCDSSIKSVEFTPVNAEYKYESLDDFAAGYKCPKGYDTGERETEEDTEAALVKTYYWNIGDNSIVEGLTKAKETDPAHYKGRPERAEMAIDNYGDFNFSTFDMQVMTGVLEGDVIELDDQASDNFCIYTPIPKCDDIIGDSNTACGKNVAAYGYEWNKVDMKMVSFEGDQDIYYLENANLRYRVPRNSTQKEIMIGRQGFYETIYDQNEDPQWVKVDDAEEIINIMELTRQNYQRQSYGYFVNPYDATVDFFMNVQLNLPVQNNKSIKRFVRVPLGRFYIVADWNFGGDTPYDLIHPIESGMENVPVLDRMEKCKATQTFAIDANKNLAMANYRYIQEYAEAPLTVFIDPKTMKPYEPNSGSFTRQNGDVITGNLRIIKQYEIYYKWTRTIAPPYTTLGHRIIVDAEHFPGTYRIVGETYCRSRDDGKDQRYQFEIPLAKLSPETNLTLQADGDPTTFPMKFKVLRRDDGVMMKLTQYLVDCNSYDGYTSGSTKVVPTDTIEDNTYDTIYSSTKEAAIRLVKPPEITRELTEEELGGEVAITEDINAVLDTSATTIAETYNTQTLEVVDRQVVRTENTEQLNHDEYTVTVENLDEEVGE